MPRVTVEPGGHTIDVLPHETLAEAAWRQGYRWPTTCWGKAECMVCAVLVRAGEEAVVPADAEEQDAVRLRMPVHVRRPASRLACRLRVRSDGAVVEKKGVRPPPEAD
ncbi:2Fe-2S iron-sulfur cluster-binding protein [Streptomyces sp. NPDC057363]|uniref:2Fe-2S iron-sulfur cluster-binding protein n=1 Tax=Streptomyces sp. NPDC057363 TaxID=3346107 RepID=UPI00362BA182